MAHNVFQDGKIPFKIPIRQEQCQTYYKIYGDLHGSLFPPLVVLHGGPGAGHEYMEPYSAIWTRHKIPVLFYDQIGCASSTHLPSTRGDKSFWQPALFIAELENLLSHLGLADRPYDILGHSWGGMLAMTFAALHQPPGLRRLILAGAPSDAQTFRKSLSDLVARLPEENSKVIFQALADERFDDSGYNEGLKLFTRTYTCRADPWPEEFLANQRNQMRDDTVRVSMLGICPFLFNGSLEHYNSIPSLQKIHVPTLIFTGEFDTAQEVCVREQFAQIPKVRWVTLAGASHMPHLDSEELLEKSLKLVAGFLHPSLMTS